MKHTYFLSFFSSPYQLHIQKRGDVDFTIGSFRDGVPHGLHIERSDNPFGNDVQFRWIKGEIVKEFNWDYCCQESTKRMHEFCHRAWTLFQTDLFPIRIMAEKAMRSIYQLWDRQVDMVEDQVLKIRFDSDLFGYFYCEDYQSLTTRLTNQMLITFLALEEGLGFLAIESLMYHLDHQRKSIEEFLDQYF